MASASRSRTRSRRQSSAASGRRRRGGRRYWNSSPARKRGFPSSENDGRGPARPFPHRQPEKMPASHKNRDAHNFSRCPKSKNRDAHLFSHHRKLCASPFFVSWETVCVPIFPASTSVKTEPSPGVLWTSTFHPK